MSLRDRIAVGTGVLASLVWAVGASGCSSSTDAGAGGGSVVLRVGAPHGLAAFDPNVDFGGATASASELVFDRIAMHAEILESDHTRMLLRLVPDSRLSADELARLVRGPGIKRASATERTYIEIIFSDEASRKRFETRGLVDAGPFRVDMTTEESVRLRRRGTSAIDVIEIVTMSADEEWRRLYGRQLDVIPHAEERRRDEFSTLQSLRIVDQAPASEVSLYMNTRNRSLSDVSIRRQIARTLDRAAIARVACGSVRCESRKPLPPASEAVKLPKRLSLIVHKDHAEGISAARVIRQQLREVGIEVEVVEHDIVADRDFYARDETQLWVAPQSLSEYNFQRFVSPERNRVLSVTGYANEDYDEAVERGDYENAQSLLNRDVPVVSLYVMSQFAVIDKKFCGDVTPQPYSWRWMADLRPCREGEQP